jgi:hypothetical protein
MSRAIILPDRSGNVGSYACNAASAVVRTEYVGQGKAPRVAEVACPACGTRHVAHLSWRKATPYDAGRKPELTLTDNNRKDTHG